MNYTNNANPAELIDPAQLEFCDANNERSILSIMSKNEDAFFSVLAKTNETDFLAPESKAYYAMLSLLHRTGYKVFDKMTLSKAAADLCCESLCSDAFIDAILNVPLALENLEVYLAKLVDDSTKYKLYTKLHNHTDTVKNNANAIDTKSSDDLINIVQSDMLSLSLNSGAISEPKHVADGLDEYIISIQDEKVDVIGLSTGYPVLDKVIDGLVPGTLMIVAARKKMGKSTFLTNIAAHVAVNDGYPVLYLDTEMTFKEWRDRVLSIISGVKERTIKHGGFKDIPAVAQKISEAATYLKKSKLYHHYLPGYNVEKISALYKKYKFKEDIKLAIFDYIKEPEASSIEAGRKEYQILGDVTTKLKDLSGQLDIPFLTAVQLNRSGDVADSDRIARYGDIVAFWGMRNLKTAEEEGWDLDTHGYYGLSIKDSRRGGGTGEAGIGFKFFKTTLTIKEVDQRDQVEQFEYLDDVKIELGQANDATFAEANGTL